MNAYIHKSDIEHTWSLVTFFAPHGVLTAVWACPCGEFRETKRDN